MPSMKLILSVLIVMTANGAALAGSAPVDAGETYQDLASMLTATHEKAAGALLEVASTPWIGTESVCGLDIDAAGNPVAVGPGVGGRFEGGRLVEMWHETRVTKFDSSLHLVWSRSSDRVDMRRPNAEASFRPADLAVARDGSILIVGGGSGGWEMRKFSPDGALQWTASLDGPDPSRSRPTRIVLDTEGNALVTGMVGSNGSGGIPELPILNVDPAGKVVWRSVIGPAGEELAVEGLAMTGDGGLLAAVTGHYSGHIVRLDARGKERWRRAFPLRAGYLGRVGDVVLEPGGAAYVVGVEYNPKNYNYDSYRWTLAKYAPDGTLVWSRTGYTWSNSSNLEYAGKLRRTADGGIIVGGVSCRPTYDSPENWYLFEVRPDGRIAWYYDVGTEMNERVDRLVLSTDGTILVAGSVGSAFIRVYRKNPSSTRPGAPR
ncbi:MAG: hypothetical protein AAB152_10530 [Candidatus Coatesbacteria bacterium]